RLRERGPQARRGPGAPRGGPPAGRRAERAPPAPGQEATQRREGDRPAASRAREPRPKAPAHAGGSAGIYIQAMEGSDKDREQLESDAADAVVELDEVLNRPGTYFNPQTEVLVVVDDSAELDDEVFNFEAYEGAEWVRISDDAAIADEQRD